MALPYDDCSDRDVTKGAGCGDCVMWVAAVTEIAVRVLGLAAAVLVMTWLGAWIEQGLPLAEALAAFEPAWARRFFVGLAAAEASCFFCFTQRID